MIATVDISHWHEGGAQADAAATAVDEGLQRAGFILVTGHRIDPALANGVRTAAREFFGLPDAVKQRYSVPVAGHGWLAPASRPTRTPKAPRRRRTSRRATASAPRPRPATPRSTESGSRPTSGPRRCRRCGPW